MLCDTDIPNRHTVEGDVQTWIGLVRVRSTPGYENQDLSLTETRERMQKRGRQLERLT